MQAAIARVFDAWTTSLLNCPFKNRSRSVPVTRSFTRSERSKKAVLNRQKTRGYFCPAPSQPSMLAAAPQQSIEKTAMPWHYVSGFFRLSRRGYFRSSRAFALKIRALLFSLSCNLGRAAQNLYFRHPLRFDRLRRWRTHFRLCRFSLVIPRRSDWGIDLTWSRRLLERPWLLKQLQVGLLLAGRRDLMKIFSRHGRKIFIAVAALHLLEQPIARCRRHAQFNMLQ